MIQNNSDKQPSSFADTVQLVEDYVRKEIITEARHKQLYYHNLDHAIAVKRRASYIFQQIEPILARYMPVDELKRWENLVGLCGFAHDMVQLFEPVTPANKPRKRQLGMSEVETANKLLKYIGKLNWDLRAIANQTTPSILFSDRDLDIIREAIEATICIRDPLAGKVEYSFSSYSIYQPYLYKPHAKTSIIARIIALADLGTLGMEGVENYIRDGILIFLEDNLSFKPLIFNCNLPPSDFLKRHGLDHQQIEAKLLAMARFMVNLARERRARFDLEVAGFAEPIRHILRHQIFIYLNQETIQTIETLIPTGNNVSLSELIDFFCLQNVDCLFSNDRSS